MDKLVAVHFAVQVWVAWSFTKRIRGREVCHLKRGVRLQERFGHQLGLRVECYHFGGAGIDVLYGVVCVVEEVVVEVGGVRSWEMGDVERIKWSGNN